MAQVAMRRAIVTGVIQELASKSAIVIPLATWDVKCALFGEFKARLKAQDGCFKWRKILRDSCFDHCPGGIEVVVRKPVAHPGRVRPLDIGLTCDELGV